MTVYDCSSSFFVNMRNYVASGLEGVTRCYDNYRNGTSLRGFFNAAGEFKQASLELRCDRASANTWFHAAENLELNAAVVRERAYNIALGTLRSQNQGIADVVERHPLIVGGVGRVLATVMVLNPVSAVIFGGTQYAISLAVRTLLKQRDADQRSSVGNVLRSFGFEPNKVLVNVNSSKDKIIGYMLPFLASVGGAFLVTQSLGFSVTFVGALGVGLASTALFYSVGTLFSLLIIDASVHRN